MKIRQKLMAIAALLSVIGLGTSHAQAPASANGAPVMQPEPKVTWSRESPPDDDSYAARNITRRQVHSMDPNIWAVSAEFAERFKMPKEWIAPDLQGAEAIAFRIEPFYKSCGWGGNPNACREDKTRCVIDVYFDHQKQPLPWRPGVRQTDFDEQQTSAWFIESFRTNPFARPRRLAPSVRLSPFADPKTGEELTWMDSGSTGTGLIKVGLYDQEVFQGISLVSFPSDCQATRKLWLTKVWVYEQDADTSPNVQRVIAFPPSLRSRIKETVDRAHMKDDAHFKQVFEDMKKQSQTSQETLEKSK